MLFFKNDAENKAARLVPDLFLLFRKALYEVKPLKLAYNKNKLWKAIDPEIRSILIL